VTGEGLAGVNLASITPLILSTTCLTKASVVWISPSPVTDLNLPPYSSIGCFFDFSLAFDCSSSSSFSPSGSE